MVYLWSFSEYIWSLISSACDTPFCSGPSVSPWTREWELEAPPASVSAGPDSPSHPIPSPSQKGSHGPRALGRHLLVTDAGWSWSGIWAGMWVQHYRALGQARARLWGTGDWPSCWPCWGRDWWLWGLDLESWAAYREPWGPGKEVSTHWGIQISNNFT